ncbi:MAG: Gfo/Idh/MocA family oxidoreductase [Lentisphaeria bacterium]|nr:Gfo/Idh/MocA family oxidoreductase [Lentisphaeria bacterium]
MTKLRAGVIGLGMGWNHLVDYMNNPDVEVVAVADRREDRFNRLEAEFGGKYGKFYKEGIDLIKNEKLDILSVAVPNNQHKDLTVAGLEAGAHVLCEKPMAMNTAEALEMLETAKRCNRKLGIDFSYRFRPQSRAMKNFVETGALGEVYYARSEWFRRDGMPGLAANDFGTSSGAGGAMGSWFFDKKQSGGGPLIDLGVHRLDLALWLMGYPEPAWVMGSTYAKIGPDRAKARGLEYTVEDLACATIKFKNGATLELGVSWASNIKEMELQTTRLVGTKCGLMQKNINEGYTYEVEFFKSENEIPFDIKLHEPTPPMPTAFTLFVEAVRDNKEFLVKPEEAVTVMRLLDAIYESAASGKPVEM